MTPEFWIVIGLLAVVAIASLYTGYKLGVSTMAHHMAEEDRNKAVERFKSEIFPHFMARYNEQVVKEATGLVNNILDRYTEKLRDMPNTEEMVSLLEQIHDEVMKEIDDEDTHSS
jgi:Tfp pilus assembly protein PilO